MGLAGRDQGCVQRKGGRLGHIWGPVYSFPERCGSAPERDRLEGTLRAGLVLCAVTSPPRGASAFRVLVGSVTGLLTFLVEFRGVGRYQPQ